MRSKTCPTDADAARPDDSLGSPAYTLKREVLCTDRYWVNGSHAVQIYTRVPSIIMCDERLARHGPLRAGVALKGRRGRGSGYGAALEWHSSHTAH